MTRYNFGRMVTSLVIVFAVGTASARATVIHSDVSGATADFSGIAENSNTDPEPVYGQPSAVGDTLTFPLGMFWAFSLDGGAPDITDGILVLSIDAQDGFVLDGFTIQEGGLTALNAPFGGFAYTQVLNFAVYQVVEIAGVPVNPPVGAAIMNFLPGNQFFYPPQSTEPFLTGFVGQSVVPLPANTTKVNIFVYNQLFAATVGPATSASIDKLNFEITAITRLIPEPATLLLGIVCLVGASVGMRGKKTM